MGDPTGFLAGRGGSTDILDLLRYLDRLIVEIRGNHHRATRGPAAEDGHRFTLRGL
jgi:hypothetical protein